MAYIQFGKCGCKGFQLDENNVIIVRSIDKDETLFVLEKMSNHEGTVAEVSFPETAEIVAHIWLLINDGYKFRTIKRLLK